MLDHREAEDTTTASKKRQLSEVRAGGYSKKCSGSPALRKERGPDERKDGEGPNDKRRKNKLGGASTSSTVSKAAAPELHPARAKKPCKRPRTCASTINSGASVWPVAAAASASIRECGATVKIVAASASTNIGGQWHWFKQWP